MAIPGFRLRWRLRQSLRGAESGPPSEKGLEGSEELGGASQSSAPILETLSSPGYVSGPKAMVGEKMGIDSSLLESFLITMLVICFPTY